MCSDIYLKKIHTNVKCEYAKLVIETYISYSSINQSQCCSSQLSGKPGFGPFHKLHSNRKKTDSESKEAIDIDYNWEEVGNVL